MPKTPSSIKVGPWLLNPATNEIRAGQVVKRLEPRVMDLLVFFAQHKGEVIGRDYLIETVWQGHFIAESTMNWAIAQLRKALGDDARNPKYLETIPKRGYRFIAALDHLVELDSQVPANQRRRAFGQVAFLPLAVVFIVALGWFTKPWHSDQVERQASSDEMVSASGESLSHLDFNHLGRLYLENRGIDSMWKAVHLFRQALRLDANSALAYCGLADAYGLLAVWGNLDFEKVRPLRRQWVNKALQLDPNLAEVHISMGCLEYHQGHYQTAIKAYRRAIALNTRIPVCYQWLGDALRGDGQYPQAIGALRKAKALSPRSAIITMDLGYTLNLVGETTEGLAYMHEAVTLDPKFAAGWQKIGEFYLTRGEMDQAMTAYQKAHNLQPHGMGILEDLATLAFRAGWSETARTVIAKMQALAPDDPRTQSLRFYWLLDENRHGDAELCLRGFLKQNPNSKHARLVWAAWEYFNGDFESALTKYAGIYGEGIWQGKLSPNFRNWRDLLRIRFMLAQTQRRVAADQLVIQLTQFAETKHRSVRFLPLLPVVNAAISDQAPQKALRDLEEALGAGWRNSWSLKWEPFWQHLREDGQSKATVAALQAQYHPPEPQSAFK